MKQARHWDLGLPPCIFLLFTGNERAEYNYKLLTSRPPRTLGRTAESISRVGSTAARRIARGRWRVCYAPHTGVLEPSDLRTGEGKRRTAAATRSRGGAIQVVAAPQSPDNAAHGSRFRGGCGVVGPPTVGGPPAGPPPQQGRAGGPPPPRRSAHGHGVGRLSRPPAQDRRGQHAGRTI